MNLIKIQSYKESGSFFAEYKYNLARKVCIYMKFSNSNKTEEW